jgi:hypothetical protein
MISDDVIVQDGDTHSERLARQHIRLAKNWPYISFD